MAGASTAVLCLALGRQTESLLSSLVGFLLWHRLFFAFLSSDVKHPLGTKYFKLVLALTKGGKSNR